MAGVMHPDRASLYKVGNGRPPIGLYRMPNIHFVQNRYKLSYPVVESGETVHRFAAGMSWIDAEEMG